MDTKIIKTTRNITREPKHAMLLSLVFPGLGQVYNGMPVRGVAFLLFRIVPLLALPVYTALSDHNTYAVQYLLCNFTAFIMHIAPSAEAALTARRFPLIVQQRSHNALLYLLYGALSLAIIIMSHITVSSFFSLSTVKYTTSPLYTQGDIVLINRLRALEPVRGDAVLHNNGDIIRIIANDTDRVFLEDGILIINNEPLKHAVPVDLDSEKLGLSSGEDIYLEYNGDRSYLIEQTMPRLKTYRGSKIIIPKKHYLAAQDIRRGDWYKTVEPAGLLGRVEGIIFSRHTGKMFFPLTDIETVQ